MAQNTQEIEQIVSKQINSLREEIKEELAKMRKELMSEIAYNNRELEKKVENLHPGSKFSANEAEKEDEGYDLKSSTSFNWVKENLADFTSQQVVDFFKKVIQNSNIKCDSVNDHDFGRNKNTFYKILDTLWDQISANLNNVSSDLCKSALQGLGSFISNLGSK